MNAAIDAAETAVADAKRYLGMSSAIHSITIKPTKPKKYRYRYIAICDFDRRFKLHLPDSHRKDFQFASGNS